MPVGQFKTRRNPETGQLESIPPEEAAQLEAEATLTQADASFLQQHREEEPAEEAPMEEEPAEAEGVGAAGAAAGAAAAFGIGGPAGAVFGGAAGFLMSQATKSKPRPIGTLEGGQGAESEDIGRNIRTLLEVQQTIARIGSPIKGLVTTKAAGSRL